MIINVSRRTILLISFNKYDDSFVYQKKWSRVCMLELNMPSIEPICLQLQRLLVPEIPSQRLFSYLLEKILKLIKFSR